jgi:DNA-directed RNA polymerase specialized sigma24 family protein
MSTHAPTRPTITAGRRSPQPWAGSTVPSGITDQLDRTADARDQLAAIAMHHFQDLVRQVAWQVGDAKAEDLVQDVIVRHLTKHDAGPRPDYTSVRGYHRLRASLITSTKNAAIDHLRRKSTRAETSVGTFMDDALRGRAGSDSGDSIPENAPRDLDSSALQDGLRRVDKRHAQLLRMKLSGATFADIGTHLGVSTTAAFNAFKRAMSAVQPILERYGAGGFCRDSGPYLLLVRQERDAETASNGERPLTDLIGSEHALEIRLHVYGDPDVDSDEGCDACQHAGAQQGSALVMYLPEPLLLVPSGGLIAAAKDTAVSVWGSVAGWLAGLSGSSGTALVDVTEGASVAVKSAAVLAAAALAVGGALTVNHVATGHDVPTRATMSLGATPASTVTGHPGDMTPLSMPPGSSPRRTTSTARSPPRPGSPAAEFAPAPEPRTHDPRKRPAGGGSAAAEFAP